MKIKNLLVLALTMLGTSLTVQAQVVKEDFSAPQTKAATDQGYYEFINLQPTDEGAEKVDKWTVGDGVLSIENSADYICSDQKWQRAIKFRNLPLKEKTLYKLSFDLKTNETYIDSETETEAKGNVDMKIMQGDENADICIQGADGSEQRANFELNAGDEQNYSKVFYFADLAAQNAAYESACAGKELYNPAKFFVGINIYNPGKYVLDNVLLEETSALESMVWNGNVIRVNYISATNATTLCGTSKSFAFDPSCATVTVNGEKVAIESVEVKADGYLYIFTEDDLDGDVKVSFTNPGDLALSGAYAGASLDFADVTATYDETFNEEGEIMSYLYDEPTLVSSVPADGSFALPQSISEFTFTFDKTISTKKTDFNDVPTATLSDGTELTLTTTDEFSKTLTFTRSGADLIKGSYTLTLSNVASEYGTPVAQDITLNFEVGKVQLAETVYTDICTTLLEGDNGSQPTGWSIMVGGSDWTGGEAKADDGSACRNINITNDNGTFTAFYLCDRAGYTYMQSPEITLPAGNIEFTVLAMSHDAASNSRTVEFRLEDMSGNVVATGSGSTTIGTDNFTTALAADAITANFVNAQEQNFILKVHNASGGWEGCRVLGFKARSYVQTEGDKADSQICLEDKTFGGAADNAAPPAGSGWNLYENGTHKTAGQDYNYNGSRIFKLSIKNLTTAYYTGSSNTWPNIYATYGEALEEGDPVLTIPAGSVDFTYYASSWKTDLRMLHFQLLSEDGQTVVYERTDSIANVNMNGSRSANVEAKKIMFSLNMAEAGNYILKFGADGEAFVGNIKIEKLGSKAAYYAGLLKTAVEAAQAELDASADAAYDGTTKSALLADVEKYSGQTDMTTAEEYNAAIAELEALTKALNTRRGNITDYITAMANLETVIGSTVGTKYEALDAYKAAYEVYSNYSAISPSSLEDAELGETTSKLQNYYNWLNNMYSTGVGLLTKQTTDLANQLVSLDETKASDVSVAKAEDAITDDQTLAYILKLKTLKAIYDKCAAGNELFISFDEDSETEQEDSVNVSSFIQNANIYTTETSTTRNLTDVKNVPGWNINIIKGSIGVQWSWSTWNGSEYNPVNDVFLLNGWNGDFTMDQNVSCLPVGKYRYVSGTQDRGMGDTSDAKTAALSELAHWTVTGTDGTNDITGEIFSYIYWQSGEKRDSVCFDISAQGQWYGLTECNSKEIDVAASADLPYGDLLIGTRPISYQSSASVDNFKLYMIGKKEGFDYAKAAAEVQKLIDGLSATGDVNGDGTVDIADVNAIISVICGGAANPAADVNGDNTVDIADVNFVIGIICGQ